MIRLARNQFLKLCIASQLIRLKDSAFRLPSTLKGMFATNLKRISDRPTIWCFPPDSPSGNSSSIEKSSKDQENDQESSKASTTSTTQAQAQAQAQVSTRRRRDADTFKD